MGVTSVGHRLTILKSVYDIKIKQDIPLESDHYVPLCECLLNQGSYFNIADPKNSRRCRGPICDGNAERYQALGGSITVTR